MRSKITRLCAHHSAAMGMSTGALFIASAAWAQSQSLTIGPTWGPAVPYVLAVGGCAVAVYVTRRLTVLERDLTAHKDKGDDHNFVCAHCCVDARQACDKQRGEKDKAVTAALDANTEALGRVSDLLHDLQLSRARDEGIAQGRELRDVAREDRGMAREGRDIACDDARQAGHG